MRRVLAGWLDPTYPAGDQAVLEIYTLQASRGDLLLGPYSQNLWHHPGPVYFYLLAPFYELGGQTETSLYAAAMILNVAAVVALVVSFSRGEHPLAGVIAAALAAAYVIRGGQFFANPWNPHVVALWVPVLVVIGARIVSGRLSLLPLAAIVGSFIVQTHVGPGLTVAGLLLTTTIAGGAALAARHEKPESRQDAPARQPPRRSWPLVAAGIGIFAVMWLPPLVEQLTSRDGNLTRLQRFFVQRTDRPGPGAAWSAFARGLSAPLDPSAAMAVETPLLKTTTPAASALALLQIGLLPFAAWLGLRKGARFTASVAGISWLATLLAFLSVTRIQGPIEDHHVFWITSLGLLNVICLLIVSLSVLWRRRAVSNRARGQAVAIVAAMLIGIAVAGAASVRSHHARAVRMSAVVRAFTFGVEQHLAAHTIEKPLVRISLAAWPEAAGVVLQLYKQGRQVSIERTWIPMFGEPMSAAGDEDAELVFADAATVGSMTTAGRHERIARHGTLFVLGTRKFQ